MRVAALDLGSNSFHLLVADLHPDGEIVPVTREKQVLRLGDEVSRTGRIGPTLAERAVSTVRTLHGLASSAGATETIAKATSAIRSAIDGSELIDRIETDAGVHVEVIDGIEEARLIFEGVRAAVAIDPGPALCLDLGGGSLEVMVGSADSLWWARSLHLGVGRLTAAFVDDDPIGKRSRRALEDHVRASLEPLADEVARFAPAMAVGSSGTLSDLVAVVRARAGDDARHRNHLSASREELLELHKTIVRSNVKQRRRLPELEPTRVELVVAGSTVLAVAIEVFAIESVTISDWALREGILRDAVESQPGGYWDEPKELRRASVDALARRCGSDDAHTAQVTRLALALFDTLGELHGLDGRARELLEFGCRLHDIGQHVSRKSHHKHAAYLVEHAQLRGFAPDEVAELAALLRHHRHGIPKASEPYLGQLDPAARERVVRLAALLRVADGLDRGRHALVDDVVATVNPDLVMVRISAHGDPELELWGARRRRDLFEATFGRELELVISGRAADM